MTKRGVFKQCLHNSGLSEHIRGAAGVFWVAKQPCAYPYLPAKLHGISSRKALILILPAKLQTTQMILTPTAQTIIQSI
jgi:hypothetical protein